MIHPMKANLVFSKRDFYGIRLVQCRLRANLLFWPVHKSTKLSTKRQQRSVACIDVEPNRCSKRQLFDVLSGSNTA